MHWTLNGTPMPDGQAELQPDITGPASVRCVYELARRIISIESSPITGVYITGGANGNTNLAYGFEDGHDLILTAPLRVAKEGLA